MSLAENPLDVLDHAVGLLRRQLPCFGELLVADEESLPRRFGPRLDPVEDRGVAAVRPLAKGRFPVALVPKLPGFSRLAVGIIPVRVAELLDAHAHFEAGTRRLRIGTRGIVRGLVLRIAARKNPEDGEEHY